MLDRDIEGDGDYSPPDSPDEEKAAEEALIDVMMWSTGACVSELREIAEEEHRVFFRNIGEDPNDTPLGDWEGAWYGIYTAARDAFDEGVRLERLRKQGEQ